MIRDSPQINIGFFIYPIHTAVRKKKEKKTKAVGTISPKEAGTFHSGEHAEHAERLVCVCVCARTENTSVDEEYKISFSKISGLEHINSTTQA